MHVEIERLSDDRCKVLLHQIPELLDRAGKISDPDVLRIRADLAKLRVLLTDNVHWQCEINGYYTIYISRHVPEVMWASACAYCDLYRKVVAGTSGGIVADVETTTNETIRECGAILDWVKHEATCEGDGRPPSTLIWPSTEFAPESREYFASKVVPYALQFFMFHEMSHAFYFGSSFATVLDEERACDAKAATWMMSYQCENDDDRRYRDLGMALAALYVAARGVDTGAIDGFTHPICYHRLLDTLTPHFSSEREDIWAFVLAMLSAHATDCGVDMAGITFDGFLDGVIAFRDRLDAVFKRKLGEQYPKS